MAAPGNTSGLQRLFGGAVRGSAAGALSLPPVIFSIAERTASRVRRSLIASSSGAAAPDRVDQICGSGSTIARPRGPARRRADRPTWPSPVDADIRLAVPLRSRSRIGMEAEPAIPEAQRRAFEADILDICRALRDFLHDGELVVGRAAVAEFAAARQRPPFQTPQQLLDIQPGSARPYLAVRLALPVIVLVKPRMVVPVASTLSRGCPCLPSRRSPNSAPCKRRDRRR